MSLKKSLNWSFCNELQISMHKFHLLFDSHGIFKYRDSQFSHLSLSIFLFLSAFIRAFYSSIQIVYFLATLGVFPDNPHLLHDWLLAIPCVWQSIEQTSLTFQIRAVYIHWMFFRLQNILIWLWINLDNFSLNCCLDISTL